MNLWFKWQFFILMLTIAFKIIIVIPCFDIVMIHFVYKIDWGINWVQNSGGWLVLKFSISFIWITVFVMTKWVGITCFWHNLIFKLNW